jgi:Kip1 ubiquitination-promoting complex protein 1
MQSIAQLDDTDRQIRGEKVSSDYLKRLKEARTLYREDLIDCVRQCTWYVLMGQNSLLVRFNSHVL